MSSISLGAGAARGGADSAFRPLTHFEALSFLQLRDRIRSAREKARSTAAAADPAAAGDGGAGGSSSSAAAAAGGDAAAGGRPAIDEHPRLKEAQWLMRRVTSYLRHTPARDLNAAIMAQVMAALEPSGPTVILPGMTLTREHKLHVLNLRPTNAIDVSLAMGDVTGSEDMGVIGYRIHKLMPRRE